MKTGIPIDQALTLLPADVVPDATDEKGERRLYDIGDGVWMTEGEYLHLAQALELIAAPLRACDYLAREELNSLQEQIAQTQEKVISLEGQLSRAQERIDLIATHVVNLEGQLKGAVGEDPAWPRDLR